MSETIISQTTSRESLSTTVEFQDVEPPIPKKDMYVSIIVTESVASELNMNLKNFHEEPIKAYKTNLLLLPNQSKNTNQSTSCKAFEDFGNFYEDIAFFRCVHMEDSTTSFLEQDDLPVVDVKEDDASSTVVVNHEFYLTPCLTRIQSLQAVRSLAHSGNLFYDKNGIYVSVYNTQLPMVSPDWVNTCRICFGSDSTEQLISPCKCKGTIALAHFSCLERWLKTSGKNKCELCQKHFEITRVPRYNVLSSIFVWLYSNSRERKRLIEDLLGLCVYAPIVFTTTNMLMMIFELCVVADCTDHCTSAALLAFCSVVGIAAIDCTFTSWFVVTFQKHIRAWSFWYRENSYLTLLLPPRKLRRCINTAQELEEID